MSGHIYLPKAIIFQAYFIIAKAQVVIMVRYSAQLAFSLFSSFFPPKYLFGGGIKKKGPIETVNLLFFEFTGYVGLYAFSKGAEDTAPAASH